MDWEKVAAKATAGVGVEPGRGALMAYITIPTSFLSVPAGSDLSLPPGSLLVFLVFLGAV